MARILGIDIREDAVYGAFLDVAFRKTLLESLIAVPIEPSFDDESRTEAERVAVSQLLDTQKRPPDVVVAGLSGKDASLRAVDLPAGASKQVGEVLRFEIEGSVPYALDEAVVDHQTISQSPTKLRVLAAAVPKDRVRARLDVLAARGIEPRELAVGAAALDGLVSLVPELRDAGPIVLLHIGAQTEVCVLYQARCVFARTLDEGLEDIEQKEGHLFSAALRRTMMAARAGGLEAPLRAYVMGESPYVHQLTEWLSQAMECEVSTLPLAPVQGTDAHGVVTFGRAVALAGRTLGNGRRLDARRGEFAPARSTGGLRPYAKRFGFLGTLVVASFLFSVLVRKNALEAEQETLVAQLASTTKDLLGEEARTAARARTLLAGRTAVEDPLPRFDAFDTLDMISSKIPQSIRHETQRLSIEIDDESRDGRFEIHGTVPNVSDRDTIATALDTHECVAGVSPGPTSPAPNNGGQNYRLEGTIECPFETPPITEERGSRSGSQRGRNERR
jgi:general secretion pathway protein L